MSLVLSYDSVLSRVRASMAGLTDPDAGTHFGARLETTALAAADFTAALSTWNTLTTVTLGAARWYKAQGDFGYDTTIQQIHAAGLKVCLTIRPDYNPVSSSHLASLATLLQTMKTNGVRADITLWHEPFFTGLTNIQFVNMVKYYGPTVRQYYPLVVVFSGDDADVTNGFYPGDDWVDKIAVDAYALSGTTQITNAQSIADNAGKPFGFWEFNGATDFVSGQSQTTVTNHFEYIRSLMNTRLAAGKRNADVLFFSGRGSPHGTASHLGPGTSGEGGFEGGLGTWTGAGGCTIAQTNSQAHSGSGSLAVTATGTSNMLVSHTPTSLGSLTANALPCVAGDVVAASGWFKAATVARSVQVAIRFYDSSGTQVGSFFGPSTADSTSAWTQRTHSATAPATTAWAVAFAQIVSPAGAGEVHWLDDPELTLIPSLSDLTSAVQFSWDYRIPLLDSMQSDVDGTGTYGGIYRLERSTDQVRWTTVRGGAGLVSSGGAVALDDYEFAADVTNYYRLVFADSGVVVATGTANILPTLDAVWVKSVARPFLNRPVTIVDFSDVGRKSRAGVFDIEGRSAPVAVSDVRGSKQFDLRVLAEDLAAARDLDLMLASGDPLFIHVPAAEAVPGGYVAVGDTVEERPGRRSVRRIFTLPCTVVAAPGPEVVGVTYTCQGVLNDYATCADLLAAFATCADLLDNVGSAEDVIVP